MKTKKTVKLIQELVHNTSTGRSVDPNCFDKGTTSESLSSSFNRVQSLFHTGQVKVEASEADSNRCRVRVIATKDLKKGDLVCFLSTLVRDPASSNGVLMQRYAMTDVQGLSKEERMLDGIMFLAMRMAADKDFVALLTEEQVAGVVAKKLLKQRESHSDKSPTFLYVEGGARRGFRPTDAQIAQVAGKVAKEAKAKEAKA